MFIKVNDGSCHESIQLILTNEDAEKNTNFFETITKNANVGATLYATGLIVKSPKKSQLIEMSVKTCEIIGKVITPDTYLPSIKNCPLELLRNAQHLRPKFRTFGSVNRIRSGLLKIIHEFFHQRDFHHVDPNIITGSDCEGAGETFTITSLCKNGVFPVIPPTGLPVNTTVDNTTIGNTNIVNTIDVPIDFKHDFFGKQTYLTVSSQLQLEALCSGLGRVYTTNPSFRAEKSKTYRHLACFTHIEWEIAFINISELMDFSEDFVRTCIKLILHDCVDDIAALDQFVSKGLIKKLHLFTDNQFARVTYDEAVDIITRDNVKIRNINPEVEIPEWGDDLGSICEKYLCDYIYKKPTFVYNFPKDLKSFYMKPNEPYTITLPNGETVIRYTCQSVDLLMPGLGELLGASIRTDNYDVLLTEMTNRKMNSNDLSWYLDLRKNATFPHGGAGLGFDRLLSLCTLQGNIRDVVPFPVAYGECSY